MRERVFVTGATGAVGSHVVSGLLGLGYGVTAVGRSQAKRESLANAGARAVVPPVDSNGRIVRSAAIAALEGHDVVINLATHMPPSGARMLLPWEWRENDRIRRDDSATLVDAAIAAGVHRFIQESFAPLYEDGGARWIDETFPMRPARYNRTVLDAEHSAARFTAAGRVGVVLRYAAFYGADELLAEMIKIVRKGWSPLPGAADAFISSIAHEDAGRATVAAVTAQVPAGIYNVTDDEPLRRADWVGVLAKAVGAPPPKMMPRWLTRVGGSGVELLSRSVRMSNAKLVKATGWSPRWRSAREGLAAAVKALGE